MGIRQGQFGRRGNSWALTVALLVSGLAMIHLLAAILGTRGGVITVSKPLGAAGSWKCETWSMRVGYVLLICNGPLPHSWRRDGLPHGQGIVTLSFADASEYLPAMFEIGFPNYWSPGVLLCIAAYFAWRRHARMSRLVPGKCIRCGYDLRGHVCGQKCPECGMVIVADVAKSDTTSGGPPRSEHAR